MSLFIEAIAKGNFTNSTGTVHSLYPNYFINRAKINKLAVSKMRIHINILNESRIKKGFLMFYKKLN